MNIFHEFTDDGAEIVTAEGFKIMNIEAEYAARLFAVEFDVVNVTAFSTLPYLCSTVIRWEHS